MSMLGIKDLATKQDVADAIAQIPIGGRATYFLSAKASTLAGYGLFSPTLYGLAESELSAVLSEPDTEYLIASFKSNGGAPFNHIPPGMWSFHINARVSSSGGTTTLIAKLYKRDTDGLETLLFSAESHDINNTTSDTIEFDYAIPADIEKRIDDDLVVKIYGKTTSNTDRTIWIQLDGTDHASHVETTLGAVIDNVPVVREGNAVTFERLAYYGTAASPLSGAISVDTTGALRGTEVSIWHNDSVTPVPAGPVRLGAGEYVGGQLNRIIMQYVGGGRIEYVVSQYEGA